MSDSTYTHGGKVWMPDGAKVNPRPTVILEVQDNKLTKKRVDGDSQNKPQPH